MNSSQAVTGWVTNRTAGWPSSRSRERRRLGLEACSASVSGAPRARKTGADHAEEDVLHHVGAEQHVVVAGEPAEGGEGDDGEAAEEGAACGCRGQRPTLGRHPAHPGHVRASAVTAAKASPHGSAGTTRFHSDGAGASAMRPSRTVAASVDVRAW